MRLDRIVSVLALVIAPSLAFADGPSGGCDGPEACCPQNLADRLSGRVTVSVGVAFLGLYNVDDKMGTWEADYYLHEAWPPTPGFFPQTEVVNEINRQSSQFDETVLRDGRCLRSRRIHSTLHTRYDLKAFPFDRQKLLLVLADAEFPANEVRYAATPIHLGLDEEARDELVAWRILDNPSFTLTQHALSWEQGAPLYDHATIAIGVERQVGFYLTRFFLPLFLIVAVALTVFWIHPEDLGSQVGIGVTCLLAVIAFQFAEASALPAVAYLTFADRVYAICYFAIALAMIESIYGNTLARRGQHDRAELFNRACRWAFPVGIAAAVTVSLLSSK